jgi:hypothetical protein
MACSDGLHLSPEANSQLAAHAGAWSEVALTNIAREFPHAAVVLLNGPEELAPRPRDAHPAFFGSFDWHSCVEMHWLLVRLLRTVPDQLDGDRVQRVLDEHFSPEVLAVEAAHLPRYERPYGYGWSLMLAAELETFDDPAARSWAAAMRPLSAQIAGELTRWLGTAAFPVRSGLHANSAFALSLSLRYARRHDPVLAAAIADTGMRWFAADADYPARFEPSGTDFLSPTLTEAELMAQLLPAEEWVDWFGRYLPGMAEGEPPVLLGPVSVSDPSDGQLAHLHGLNLSRAWCFRRLAGSLPAGDRRVEVMLAAADRHRDASLAEAVGSDYMVEHWLAAYAVLLTTSELEP